MSFALYQRGIISFFKKYIYSFVKKLKKFATRYIINFCRTILYILRTDRTVLVKYNYISTNSYRIYLPYLYHTLHTTSLFQFLINVSIICICRTINTYRMNNVIYSHYFSGTMHRPLWATNINCTYTSATSNNWSNSTSTSHILSNNKFLCFCFPARTSSCKFFKYI